jgi:membrane protease YdiL (CAAX protease family)
MADASRDRGDILTYLGLATLLSGVWELIIILEGHLGSGGSLYVIALMWSPGVAALLTCRLRGIPLAELGWGWPATRWILAGWLIPLGYTLIAYVAIWVSGYGRFADPTFVDQMAKDFGIDGLPRELAIAWFALMSGTAGVVRACASALGEEIGWRGFLVPRLARVMSPLGVAMVSGVVWTLYHVAILVGADYNSGTPLWWGLSCFTVMIMSLSVVMTWLRLRSGSVWPAVLLHGAHNLFVQGVFTPLTGNTGDTKWAVDEFGAALAIASLVLAIWVVATGRLARSAPVPG